MYGRLERWVLQSEALSASLMFRRRALFDVERGFETRARIEKAKDEAMALWYRWVELR